MATSRVTRERAARLMVIVLAVGIPLAGLMALAIRPRPTVELHGRLPEDGGWTPGDFTAAAGQPIHLRLISDDVMHGFAIGQSDLPALDLPPGQVVETTITFDHPGKYVYYCTRWCGPDHWRMRGTIEVTGPGGATQTDPPLYMALGIDIDAPHPAEVVPPARPSAVRGAALGLDLAVLDLQPETLRARSPSQAWQALRLNASLARLGDAQLWDLVAFAWREGAGPGALKESEGLYNANCAACHGSQGAGDGVFAQSLSRAEDAGEGMGELKPPADFTDATQMLGASSALLQGKILRGGMGTGMPSWGPIFSERQIWALVDYLWTFQFDDMEDR
ncbi:MAG TPA: c-type cytochrome [Anaerolineales bacterium]|nr:c-type cytochrome [Anaerolineales bacterium]